MGIHSRSNLRIIWSASENPLVMCAPNYNPGGPQHTCTFDAASRSWADYMAEHTRCTHRILSEHQTLKRSRRRALARWRASARGPASICHSTIGPGAAELRRSDPRAEPSTEKQRRGPVGAALRRFDRRCTRTPPAPAFGGGGLLTTAPRLPGAGPPRLLYVLQVCAVCALRGRLACSRSPGVCTPVAYEFCKQRTWVQAPGADRSSDHDLCVNTHCSSVRTLVCAALTGSLFTCEGARTPVCEHLCVRTQWHQ